MWYLASTHSSIFLEGDREKGTRMVALGMASRRAMVSCPIAAYDMQISSDESDEAREGVVMDGLNASDVMVGGMMDPCCLLLMLLTMMMLLLPLPSNEVLEVKRGSEMPSLRNRTTEVPTSVGWMKLGVRGEQSPPIECDMLGYLEYSRSISNQHLYDTPSPIGDT